MHHVAMKAIREGYEGVSWFSNNSVGLFGTWGVSEIEVTVQIIVWVG